MKKIYFKILVIILIIIGSFSVSFANEDEDADYNETKKSIDSYIDNQLEKIDLKEIQIKINKIKEIFNTTNSEFEFYEELALGIKLHLIHQNI